MVCPNDAQIRQQLETLYQQSPSIPFRTRLIDFARQIGAAIVYELTRDRSAPHISTFYTVDGKQQWHVYDPMTKERFTTQSELEVRIWLESRYLDR